MGPLDANARREGYKGMEKSLTAAARVGRKLKAGRPRALTNEPLEVIPAMHRVVQEANRARNLMIEGHLDPKDLRCALVYCTPEEQDLEGVVHWRWLPDDPKATNPFVAWFAELGQRAAIYFLGILWHQVDREAQSTTLWLTPFLGGVGSKAEVLLLRAKEAVGKQIQAGGKILDN